MRSSRLLSLCAALLFLAACAGIQNSDDKKNSNNNGGNSAVTVSFSTISISPKNAFVTEGAKPRQFTAVGVYPDNTTKDITNTATWSSTNLSVATIDDAGLATIEGPGTTTITAKTGSLSASSTLMVSTSSSGTVIGPVADNVLPITVNGQLCSAGSYLNKPCVEVTICEPDGSPCQTISDILLDTGSTGLRIFKQAINTMYLPYITSGSGKLGNCIFYGDGTSHWGPVRTAKVILGGEPAVEIPIQVIDADFGPPPASCGDVDHEPSVSGFNGILGVGLFKEDCGPLCTRSKVGVYFSCSNGTCSDATASLSNQVKNPVALLPEDNNGVLVQFPEIPSEGLPSVRGNLILGIGTRSNNSPSGMTVYKADDKGEFTTYFYGTTYAHSFIDSGSNGFFFTPPALRPIPNCPSPNTEWFCPSSTLYLSAAISGSGSTNHDTVSFRISNLEDLATGTGNNVFSEVGAVTDTAFDWGLPFYFGKSVYLGIEGTSSSLGTGPFWAF